MSCEGLFVSNEAHAAVPRSRFNSRSRPPCGIRSEKMLTARSHFKLLAVRRWCHPATCLLRCHSGGMEVREGVPGGGYPTLAWPSGFFDDEEQTDDAANTGLIHRTPIHRWEWTEEDVRRCKTFSNDGSLLARELYEGNSERDLSPAMSLKFVLYVDPVLAAGYPIMRSRGPGRVAYPIGSTK